MEKMDILATLAPQDLLDHPDPLASLDQLDSKDSL